MSQTIVAEEGGRESLAITGSAQTEISSRQRLPTPSASSIRNPQSAIRNLAPDRLYHVILLAVSSTVLLAALLLSIRDRSQVLLPLLHVPLPELCMLRRMAGIDCPGCGLTRCFISLAHGDITAAWSYNPAGLWLFMLVAMQIPFRSYQLWRINRGKSEIIIPWSAQIALGILAIGLLAQWSLRLAGVAF